MESTRTAARKWKILEYAVLGAVFIIVSVVLGRFFSSQAEETENNVAAKKASAIVTSALELSCTALNNFHGTDGRVIDGAEHYANEMIRQARQQGMATIPSDVGQIGYRQLPPQDGNDVFVLTYLPSAGDSEALQRALQRFIGRPIFNTSALSKDVVTCGSIQHAQAMRQCSGPFC